MVTDRQLHILDLIVKEYVKTGQAISSQQLLDNYKLNLSSATIRNEMLVLEKNKFIEKAYKSAGRVPTNEAYKYYLSNINSNPKSIEYLQKKLEEILNNRNQNIDETIMKALNLVNEATNTLSISKTENTEARLEDLKVYEIGKEKFMILVVANNGTVHNTEVTLKNVEFEEIATAINIFSERLKGTSLNEIIKKASQLKEIILMNVKTLEDKFQDVIKLVFSKAVGSTEQWQGTNALFKANSVTMNQLQKILELVENKTIWKVLKENETFDKGNTSVSLGIKELEDISIINRKIKFGDNNRTLTIVGSKQQDYEKIFTLLDLIETKIKGG